MPKLKWLDDPEEHDYPAAGDYLSLLLPQAAVDAAVAALRAAPTTAHRAKDILRASGLAALPETNRHVASDLKKVEDGKALSPILLIRGNARLGVPLQVADGYHRVCAGYHLDENVEVPGRIVDLPEG